jgi:hypothetical protein
MFFMLGDVENFGMIYVEWIVLQFTIFIPD